MGGGCLCVFVGNRYLMLSSISFFFGTGIYHLRILLKNQYPMQAPDILVMTPQGRFEPNRKICIDGLTSFHEGSWRPAWGVRTGG